MNLKYLDAGAVRAVEDGGKRKIEVLAIPYGSTSHRDRKNQWLSPRTQLMIEIGEQRPTMYKHGLSPQGRMMESPPVLGFATVTRRDQDGVWMETELDDSELSTRTWEAALRGEARASTGSVGHLMRPQDKSDGSPTPGEVLVWPIAELSVWDDSGDNWVPVSDDAIVLPLRAIYKELEIDFPEAFKAGEATGAVKRSNQLSIRSTGGTTMDQIMADDGQLLTLVSTAVNTALDAREARDVAAQEHDDAIRASVLEDIEANPQQYRATFNVQKEINKDLKLTEAQAARGMTLEDKKEVHEFVWLLRHPSQMPEAMRGTYKDLYDGDAMRVLEETVATEAGAFVPEEMLNDIVGIRDETSLISRLNIFKWNTSRLIFNVPVETTGSMVALAEIAEEGAYGANEPAFRSVPVTVKKYGAMVTCTEEMLEDQNVFERFFVKKCGFMWGLAENIRLRALVIAGGTVGVHLNAANTLTDPELMTGYFAMGEPWRDGAQIIMGNLTMAAMRALLIATPRAYGDFPIFGGGPLPTWMDMPVYLNSNWSSLAVLGDTDVFASMISPDAFCWVERRALSIFVDPYGDRANGRIRYFPSTRFNGAELNALGNIRFEDHA